MKNIVFFTGAGVSKESGINTFRDGKDALWENYKISEVATREALHTNRDNLLNFYNERHEQLKDFEPNEAHKLIAGLEENHMVSIITQNIDDLHERAGSTDVLHLHGELTKKRNLGTNEMVDWECGDLLEDDEDLPEKFKFRPHVVLFGEMPYNVEQSTRKLAEADILVIIGTSLQIGYVTPLLATVNPEATVYNINPEKIAYLDAFLNDIKYIEKGATEGMVEFIEELND